MSSRTFPESWGSFHWINQALKVLERLSEDIAFQHSSSSSSSPSRVYQQQQKKSCKVVRSATPWTSLLHWSIYQVGVFHLIYNGHGKVREISTMTMLQCGFLQTSRVLCHGRTIIFVGCCYPQKNTLSSSASGTHNLMVFFRVSIRERDTTGVTNPRTISSSSSSSLHLVAGGGEGWGNNANAARPAIGAHLPPTNSELHSPP